MIKRKFFPFVVTLLLMLAGFCHAMKLNSDHWQLYIIPKTREENLQTEMINVTAPQCIFFLL